jgi:hypothetical protein
VNLSVVRKWFTKTSTVGELSIDGRFYCFTLEDVVRPAGEKIFGKTAIPAGRYRVTLHASPHFGCIVPMLLDVPGFKYILIHWGNKPEDTEGCLLVGHTHPLQDPNFIGRSKLAFEPLNEQIIAAIQGGEEVWIEIR